MLQKYFLQLFRRKNISKNVSLTFPFGNAGASMHPAREFGEVDLTVLLERIVEFQMVVLEVSSAAIVVMWSFTHLRRYYRQMVARPVRRYRHDVDRKPERKRAS